jgi:hypothetical protein
MGHLLNCVIRNHALKHGEIAWAISFHLFLIAPRFYLFSAATSRNHFALFNRSAILPFFRRRIPFAATSRNHFALFNRSAILLFSDGEFHSLQRRAIISLFLIAPRFYLFSDGEFHSLT